MGPGATPTSTDSRGAKASAHLWRLQGRQHTTTVFSPRRRADPDTARRLIQLSGDVESNPGPGGWSLAGVPKKDCKALRILQLNANGLRARLPVLCEALRRWEVDVAMVQETNLRLGEVVSVPDFSGLFEARVQHRAANPSHSGGVAVLVRRGLPHRRLDGLDLPPGAALESLAVEVCAPGAPAVKLLNVYRPPVRGGVGDARDGSLHLGSWPVGRDWLVFADANGHGYWDPAREPDEVGEVLEDWLDGEGWACLNSGAATRVSPSGVSSSPDVTLGHGRWLGRVDWRVAETIGSDHLPIVVDVDLGIPGGRRGVRRGPARWSFGKADWARYAREAERLLWGWSADSFRSVDAAAADFTGRVLEAAKCLPRGARPSPKSWWNGACDAALAAARAADRELRRRPGDAAAAAAKRQARAQADRTYREEKQKAWSSFAASLDPDTPSSKVWGVVRALDGRGRKPLPDVPLQHGGRTAVTPRAKANLAAGAYAAVSRLAVPRAVSKAAYETVRAALREYGPGGPEEAPFTSAELNRALACGKGKAAGPDEVPPQLLRRLPPRGLGALLSLANRSFEEGRVPGRWRRAVVVPALKEGKSPDQATSYRPISLLSVVGKTLETMLTARVKRWAEGQGLLPPEQAGFRSGRSTADYLASLAQKAFDALQRRPAVRSLVTAVDFRAAFDRLWRGRLLERLAQQGLPRRWLRWLRSFLTDRRAAVRWGSCTGRSRVLSEGVPQGSPLSPLLFILYTAPLVAAIREASPGAHVLQFADDLTVATEDKDPGVAGEAAQAALSGAERWCGDNLVSLAPGKTEAVLLTCDPRQVNNKIAPALVLAGEPVAYNPRPRILGVTFDSQVSFGPQAAEAARRLRRRSAVLTALAARSWGAQTATLRRVYTAFARPAAMYAAGVWLPFSSPSYRARLERANYAAARTITGVSAGARASVVVRDAGLLPLEALALTEGAKLLVHCRRFQVSHPLAQLAASSPARRLKARGGGLRPCWRSEGEATLARLGLGGLRAEELLPFAVLPAPWDRGDGLTFLEVLGTSREDPPEVRSAVAHECLDGVCSRFAPSLEVWSDGSAVGGVVDGGGASSSGAARRAARGASRPAASAVLHPPRRLPWRRLWPGWRRRRNWRRTTACSWRLTLKPFGTAFGGRTLAASTGMPRSRCASWRTWRRGYRSWSSGSRATRASPSTRRPTLRPSGGLRSPSPRHGRHFPRWPSGCARAPNSWRWRPTTTRPRRSIYTVGWEVPLSLPAIPDRRAEVLVFQLRAGRAPFLAATLHRWGRSTSAACQRCGSGEDDTTEHFILNCPALQAARRKHGVEGLEVLKDVERCAAFLREAGFL